MAREEDILAAIALFERMKPDEGFDEMIHKRMGVWAVLYHLTVEEKPLTSKEISDAMKVSSARMTVLLKKMEREGLVEKNNSPKDARAILVTLTPKGEEKAQEIKRHRYECMEKILGQYTLEELEYICTHMEKIHQFFHNSIEKHQKEDINS